MSAPTLLGSIEIAKALERDKREQFRRIDDAYEEEMAPTRQAFKAKERDATFRRNAAKKAVNAWHLKAMRAVGVPAVKVHDLNGYRR